MATRTNAKPAAKPAAEAKPAPLDFASLTVADVKPEEMPKRDSKSKVKDTPVYGWMQDSRQNNVAKSVTIPAANVKEIVNLIRQAANVLACGARIVEKDAGNGNVTVTFTAKDRRAYKARTPKG